MNIKVPKKIKICAHTYDTKFILNLILDDRTDAMVHHRLGYIGVDSTRTGTMRDEAYLHEVFEIINRLWNCQLEHDNMDRLAEGFLVFLQELGITLDWSEIEDA